MSRPYAAEADERLRRHQRLEAIRSQLTADYEQYLPPPPYEHPPSYDQSQLARQAVVALSQQATAEPLPRREQHRTDFDRAACKIRVMYIIGGLVALLTLIIIVIILSCRKEEASLIKTPRHREGLANVSDTCPVALWRHSDLLLVPVGQVDSDDTEIPVKMRT